MGRYIGELEAVKLALQLRGQEEEASHLLHQQGLAPDTQQLTTSPLSQLDWAALGAPSQASPSSQPQQQQPQPPAPPQQSWPGSMDPWDLAAASAPLPSQAQAALALPTFDSSSYLPVSEAARERHMLLSTGLSQRPRTRSGSLAAPVYPHPVPRPEAVQQASLMDADHRPPGGVGDLMPSPQLELQLGPQQLEVSLCSRVMGRMVLGGQPGMGLPIWRTSAGWRSSHALLDPSCLVKVPLSWERRRVLGILC